MPGFERRKPPEWGGERQRRVMSRNRKVIGNWGIVVLVVFSSSGLSATAPLFSQHAFLLFGLFSARPEPDVKKSLSFHVCADDRKTSQMYAHRFFSSGTSEQHFKESSYQSQCAASQGRL